MMERTSISQLNFINSVEPRFNQVKRCSTMNKFIEFLDMIDATERSMFERGMDPSGYGKKFSNAAVNAIPATTECEVIKLEAVRNGWDWKKIRDEALAYKIIAYPNTAEFDKILGVKSVLQVDTAPSEFQNDDADQVGFTQSYNAPAGKAPRTDQWFL